MALVALVLAERPLAVLFVAFHAVAVEGRHAVGDELRGLDVSVADRAVGIAGVHVHGLHGVDAADEALVEELAAAVLTRVDAWAAVANTPQGAAGPLAPVLGEYFDMVPLLGRQVAAVSPNGLPLAVGVFAGLDIWGRATIKTDAGEQEFPPEAVRIRGL